LSEREEKGVLMPGLYNRVLKIDLSTGKQDVIPIETDHGL